ncbi:MAG: nitronate monooxygenase [Nocardiopsaceae bacterium]|nr:nitronate monooxygenase [Nocardiopsaceae bacterium]
MSRRPWHTRATELFGVRYPIVQTGMGWVSGAGLTAATANAGGLGILAGVTLSAEELRSTVRRVRERTDAPFGVNLRADLPDLGDRLALLSEEGVRIISFAGAPTPRTVELVHEAGAVCVGTVGMRRHAEKIVAAGADAVIAQGGEGGGHTGPVPTTLLLPAVLDAVGDRVPVLAAGGFFDGRGMAAALSFGADGIAMGTRFLLTQESRVPDHIKRRYLDTGPTGTVVTTAVDGMSQRLIRTPVVDRLADGGPLRRILRAATTIPRLREVTGQPLSASLREGWSMRRHQGRSLAQVAAAANAPLLIKASLVDGDDSAGILPTGQVTGNIDDLPTVAELIDGIVGDAARALDRARRITDDPESGGGHER